MASFISALSLLILVLVNGYFAIPIVDEPSNKPFPSSLDDSTTVQVAHLQLVTDNETIESLIKHKQPIGESVGFKATTSSDNLSVENIARASRMFDESITSELSTPATDGSSVLKTELKDLSSTIRIDRRQRDIKTENEDEPEPEPEIETETEKDEEITFPTETNVDKRDMSVESTTNFTTSFTSTTPLTLPTTTIPSTTTTTTTREPSTTTTTTTTEPSTTTTTTTTEPSTTTTTTEPSTTTTTTEPSTSTTMPTTTTTLPTIPTTSTLLPQFTTLETTTKKYTGLLTDDKEPQDEIKEEPFKKPTKTKVQPDDTSDEVVKTTPKQNPIVPSDDNSDSSAPVAALYDQDEMNKLSTLPSGIMVLDEHNDVVIPGVLKKFSTSDTKNKEERKQLNQGEKSSHSEEEKSDN